MQSTKNIHRIKETAAYASLDVSVPSMVSLMPPHCFSHDYPCHNALSETPFYEPQAATRGGVGIHVVELPMPHINTIRKSLCNAINIYVCSTPLSFVVLMTAR
jgi:hypothetical protein